MTPEDLIRAADNLPEKDYQELLAVVKEHIQTGRTKAALAANNELVVMNWFIGRDLLARQEEEGWGARVIDQLSADLRSEGHRGFSERNLKYMRAFAAAWPDKAIVQGTLAQLSWYHNLRLLGKLDNAEDRLWYAEQAIATGLLRTGKDLHHSWRLGWRHSRY